MGLDMYLYAKKYVSGWPHADAEERNEYDRLVEMYGMEDVLTEQSPSAHVQFTVAYWRKANAIHGWFVREVQGGEDDCNAYDVSIAQLKDLRAICQDVLLTKERFGEEAGAARGMELLPPVEGFFFGVADITEWYWEDLDHTVKRIDCIIEKLPDARPFGWWLEYRSSW